MITKELFCKAMKSIQEEWANKSRLEKALEENLIDGWVTVKSSQTFSMLIDILKELFQDTDKYSTIEWWLFDKVEKKIYNEDNTVLKDVTAVEDLYDYLIENMKEGEQHVE